MNTIQLQIARLRREKGITQEALGAALGVSYQAVSKWENASSLPDVGLLPIIAEYFAVSVDELLGLNRITPEPAIETVYDVLRDYLSEVPAEQLYRVAGQLAGVLHEGVITEGFRQWPGNMHDVRRLDGFRPEDETAQAYEKWGMSAHADQRGQTLLIKGLAVFMQQKFLPEWSNGDIKRLSRLFSALGQESTLRMLVELLQSGERQWTRAELNGLFEDCGYTGDLEEWLQTWTDLRWLVDNGSVTLNHGGMALCALALARAVL